MTFQLQVRSRSSGKPVKPIATVREDVQQFPSQIKDGGRWVLSLNKCVKSCLAQKDVLILFFFTVKQGRGITPHMLCFGIQFQLHGEGGKMCSLPFCLKAKD